MVACKDLLRHKSDCIGYYTLAILLHLVVLVSCIIFASKLEAIYLGSLFDVPELTV